MRTIIPMKDKPLYDQTRQDEVTAAMRLEARVFQLENENKRMARQIADLGGEINRLSEFVSMQIMEKGARK